MTHLQATTNSAVDITPAADEHYEFSYHVKIGQFFILPEFQNLGIGSEILGRVLRRADERQVAAKLAVLAGNRSQSLYRRHGFVTVTQSGALCHMERRPVG